jgi:hypothetical protein
MVLLLLRLHSFTVWNQALEAAAVGLYHGAALLNHSCEPNCWTCALGLSSLCCAAVLSLCWFATGAGGDHGIAKM